MPPSKKNNSSMRSASTRSHSRSSVDPKKRRREASVYDAVAGRVSSIGFIPIESRVYGNRDTPSTSAVAVPPEEVLFRRRGAPVRYEENDVYWADRCLTEKQKLPDSDLLKAIHTYASDFYGRNTKNQGAVDFESLDETALLSLGILLEEVAGHVLGDTGDMAFVEGEEVEETEAESDVGITRSASQADTEPAISTTASANSESVDVENGESRKKKKRKLRHDGQDQ